MDLAPGRSPIEWTLAGQLLAACRAWEGDAAVSAAAASHRGALGCVFPHLPLTAADRRRRDWVAPSPVGYLSHNWSVALPIRRALLHFFRALLGRPTLVVVHRAEDAQPEDAALLVALSRPGHAGELPGPAADVRVAVGLGRWRPRAGLGAVDNAHLTEQRWRGGAIRDGAERYAGADAVGIERAPRVDPWRGAEERAWFRRLGSGGALTGAEVDAAIVCIERAFGGLGFRSACALGEAVLRKAGAVPGRAQRARLHTLTGVAAYNQKVRSDGDERFATALGAHFDAALAAEDDPARRPHLCYRRGIQLARREARFADAEEAFSAAVHEARTPVDRAWALNGRAYLRMRQGALPAAVADAEAALAGLGRAAAPERVATRMGLLSNLVRLYAAQGARSASRRCQRATVAVETRIRGAPLLGAPHLVWDAIRAGRWREARRHAETWADLARGWDQGWDEIDAHALRAQLAEHVGDASGAAAAWRQVCVLRGRAGVPVADASTAEAEVCVRGGLDLRVLDDLDVDSDVVLALRALSAALRGDATAADSLGDRAIDAAIPGGAETLIPVLMLLADALAALGRRGAARDAWAEAARLAGPEPGEAAFRASVALARDASGLEACLAAVPRAVEEPGAWRALPVLARKVRALGVAHVVGTRQRDAWRITRGGG